MKALALILLVFLVVFPSCEGEEGPVGPEGVAGVPGSGIGYSNDPSPGYGSGLTFVEAASVTFEITEEESNVFIIATDNVWGPGAACISIIRLVIDDVVEDNTLVMVDIPNAVGGNNGASLTTSTMLVLSQGSHTVKLERGGCSFDMNPHLNVIILGN